MKTVLPVHARTLALHAQHLTIPNGFEKKPDRNAISDIIRQLLFLQIDTLQMVHRAHYLTLWSRLGSFNTSDLDALASPEDRRLYEYWGHAASFMPLEYFRFSLPAMKKRQNYPSSWTQQWLAEPASLEAISLVRKRIDQEGALRSIDFPDENHKGDGWFEWKPVKHALEYLFTIGELMVDRRENFQRFYDKTERVLPDRGINEDLSLDQAQSFYVERAAFALGICRPEQVAEYAYLLRGVARPFIREHIMNGVFLELKGSFNNEKEADLIIHRDQLPVLERIQDGEITAGRATFLNPFDNLFWAKGRDQDFWGFTQVLEAYKKKEDRLWGYYSMPILIKDQLVGRFDPKLDRKGKRLILRSLNIEKGQKLSDGDCSLMANAMNDFMHFHEATELIIETSEPPDAGQRLMKAL